jgi:hypothetical protein
LLQCTCLKVVPSPDPNRPRSSSRLRRAGADDIQYSRRQPLQKSEMRGTAGNMWHPFDKGSTIGTRGSEEGTIGLDDEHDLGGRITLECAAKIAPFAITCGIYGWMMHTRYFSNEEDAGRAVGAMKDALDEILQLIPERDDPAKDAKVTRVCGAIEAFVGRFST